MSDRFSEAQVALETVILTVLGVSAVIVIVLAGLMMRDMGESQRSQGGVFYVGLFALFVLGAIVQVRHGDGQAPRPPTHRRLNRPATPRAGLSWPRAVWKQLPLDDDGLRAKPLGCPAASRTVAVRQSAAYRLHWWPSRLLVSVIAIPLLRKT